MTKSRGRRGQVGQQTFDAVKKAAAKGITLKQAFEEVARATNRQPGTIAVTYYRIGRRAGGNGSGRAKAAKGGSDVKGILSRISAAVRDLERAVSQQAHEIERLRGESMLAERIRKALRS